MINMPIKKSAIKRAKQNITRRDHNRSLKQAFRLNVKNILKDIKAGKTEDAVKNLPAAYKALDKAAKKNAIHKNAAARRKSRLMKKINAVIEPAKTAPKKSTKKKEEK